MCASPRKKQIQSLTLDDIIKETPKKTKFLDDLSFKEGKKAHKLAQNKTSTPKKLDINIVSQARKISSVYCSTNTVPTTTIIPNGFYDVIGLSQDLPELLNVDVSNLKVPILLVDPQKDNELKIITNQATNLCSLIPSQEVRAKVLSTFVCNIMGGCQTYSEKNNLFINNYKMLMDSLRLEYHNIIPLGKVIYGKSRERALLFKYLADRVNLCGCLRRSFDVVGEVCTWNEITIENSTFVVDLKHNPSTLYPTQGTLATEYITNIISNNHISSLAEYTFPINEDIEQKNSRWINLPDLQSADVVFIEEIGKGRYANVYKAKLKFLTCAAKVIQTTELQPSVQKSINRELQLMQTIKDHPHILTTFGYERKRDTITIFTELWDCSLKDVIKKIAETQRPLFSLEELKTIVLGLCKALHYLHTLPQKVIHRDIKSQNMLASVKDGTILHVVLCDFGVSKKVINPDKPITAPVGTSRWMAPEVHKSEPYDEMIDIWSLGMTMVELATLKLPYHDKLVLDVKDIICTGTIPKLGNIEVENPNATPLVSFIMQCLKLNPKERPSAQECVDIASRL